MNGFNLILGLNIYSHHEIKNFFFLFPPRQTYILALKPQLPSRAKIVEDSLIDSPRWWGDRPHSLVTLLDGKEPTSFHSTKRKCLSSRYFLVNILHLLAYSSNTNPKLPLVHTFQIRSLHSHFYTCDLITKGGNYSKCSDHLSCFVCIVNQLTEYPQLTPAESLQSIAKWTIHSLE